MTLLLLLVSLAMAQDQAPKAKAKASPASIASKVADQVDAVDELIQALALMQVHETVPNVTEATLDTEMDTGHSPASALDTDVDVDVPVHEAPVVTPVATGEVP